MAFSIRTRLTFWYVSLLMISFLSMGAIFSYSLYSIFITRIDAQITSVADMLPHTVINPRGKLFVPGDFAIMLERFFGIKTSGNHIQVLEPHGKVVAVSSGLGKLTLPLEKESYANALKGISTFQTVTKRGQFPVRMISRPVIFKGRGLVAIVQVGSSLELMEEVFRSLFYIFIFGAAASLVIAGAIGWYLARKALAPVTAITATARRIGAENLNERIEVENRGDEIGKLASTVNEMIERLEDSFSQIKQFSADASHELKTPLTILKGEMEIALRSTGEPQLMRDVITSSLEEVDRMSNIVKNLLDLTKIGVEKGAAALEGVHLETVLMERFEHFKRFALDRGVTLRVVKNEPAVVEADPLRIGQLFYNLIDNAIKYTGRGGDVSLSVSREGDEAVFKVRDTGVGIMSEDLPHVFDRFYRVDKARTREAGGAGLGLSICKEIVETYGGTISVESSYGEGTAFTVRFPLFKEI
ncbi:MAG: sensor histidine kinase [Thermodesulfobacteriota bacterium]